MRKTNEKTCYEEGYCVGWEVRLIPGKVVRVLIP